MKCCESNIFVKVINGCVEKNIGNFYLTISSHKKSLEQKFHYPMKNQKFRNRRVDGFNLALD